MSVRGHPIMRFMPHLSFALMALLLALVWIAGGASRADVIGQTVTRAGCWAIAIAFILFAARPQLRAVAPVAILIFAAAALVALQLVPLPPSVWTALPGRELLMGAAEVSGLEQPWRPISISPAATFNALSSLIVPVLALLLAAGLSLADHRRLALLLLALVVLSCVIGLLQFSGARFDHPLVNDVATMVSASFANRNHFALFAAIGCVLAPAWAFGQSSRRNNDQRHWRGLVALGLVLLFALIILATGSRMGILLGVLGILLGLLGVMSRIRAELQRIPVKIAIPLVGACAVLLLGLVALSFGLGRAASFDRAIALEGGADLRVLALPTVLAMVKTYFPIGSGFGAFDPVYRIDEPTDLLSRSYFNHAHNDLAEVLLDGGLAALLLLLAAIVWWGWSGVRAWRMSGSQSVLPRAGWAILLLILIASIVDYPARTPMIMVVMVIAAVWLQASGWRMESGAADQGGNLSPRTAKSKYSRP